MSKESEAATAKNRYLTFMLDQEHYGVEILRVKEIIGYQKPTHIPRTPSYVLGVLNLRGVIIPIIDLRTKLGMVSVEPDTYTAIIIAQIHNSSIGFVVDQVQEVAAFSDEAIGEPPEFGAEVNTAYISGIAKSEKQVAMLLDLERIFDSQEAQSLQQLTD